MFESIQTWLQLNTIPIVIILVVAYCLAKFGDAPLAGFIRRTVRYHAHGDSSAEDVKKRQDTLISMFVTLMRVVVWTVAVFTVLGRFGIDLTPLIAGASVLGVALAFGAQSLIKDFLSGMFIILENQYRVGDVVEVDGAGGTVEHISIRTTVVRDNDGSVHYVPNGNVMHAINRTMGYAKVNIAIAVKPQTDIDKLADVINTVGTDMSEDAKWQKKILDPPHFLSIGTFSDTALEVKIIGKTQPTAQWSVSGELRKRLLAEFKKHNIELAPFVTPPASGKKK
ncbi:MAG TPA: mechanosensitive ion channel family protein [Candidatus Saccharimonadales bacterium]|nr:mechanosensitive ion channel family protein [Candidatus Saccharimonadales bacterium]